MVTPTSTLANGGTAAAPPRKPFNIIKKQGIRESIADLSYTFKTLEAFIRKTSNVDIKPLSEQRPNFQTWKNFLIKISQEANGFKNKIKKESDWRSAVYCWLKVDRDLEKKKPECLFRQCCKNNLRFAVLDYSRTRYYLIEDNSRPSWAAASANNCHRRDRSAAAADDDGDKLADSARNGRRTIGNFWTSYRRWIYKPPSYCCCRS
uniref:Uncharacterized protein n=1 Tax=Romanomermis culicivorax TaxID=13658 RepID=A0A915KVT4_ROMCU